MSISIRPAETVDIPGIVALITDRIGEEDAPEARLVLEDPKYDRTRWTVAVDGDKVVSTMGTYPMLASFGICEIPAALVEFVATDTAYEGQGLVRRQFAYHQADLARRGELFEVMVGITYFYRRLGYEYALPVAPWQTIPGDEIPQMPEGWSLRIATEADQATILQLQRPVADVVDFAVSLSPQMWSFVLRSPVYETFVAERYGAPQACGRIYIDGDDPFLMDLAGESRDALLAVVAGAATRKPDSDLMILTRPGASPNLDDLGSLDRDGQAYYARVGDPVRWLNAVRPELSRRLRASSLAGAEGEAMISLYASSIRFSYADGEVGEFVAGTREQAPISKGGSGVPPDVITALLIGPDGFSGPAQRYPDVMGGKQEELMNILFPPLSIDVQSWVIP